MGTRGPGQEAVRRLERRGKPASAIVVAVEAEVELARGKTVPEVVRKLGVTKQTYYR
jgi:hypothetical protein